MVGGDGRVDKNIRQIAEVLLDSQIKITLNNQKEVDVSVYFLVRQHFL